MILLPTHNKPLSFKRFVTQYQQTGATQKACVIMEHSDVGLYDSIAYPHHWITVVLDGGKGAATHMNRIFDMFPDEDYYAYLADDVFPITDEWDIKLRDSCIQHGMAYAKDGYHNQTFACHGFLSGKVVRAVGCLNPFGFDHYGFDNFWFHACKDANRIKYYNDVFLRHDQEPKPNKWQHDTVKLEQVRNGAEWNGYINRLRQLA